MHADMHMHNAYIRKPCAHSPMHTWMLLVSAEHRQEGGGWANMLPSGGWVHFLMMGWFQPGKL